MWRRVGKDLATAWLGSRGTRTTCACALLALLLGMCLALAACGGSTVPGASSSSTDPDDQVTTSSGAKTWPPVDQSKLAHKDPDDETTTSTTSPSPETVAAKDYARVDGDKDNDVGAPGDDTTNKLAFAFGHAASAADRSAITTLIKRYYAIALAGDAAKGCAMLYSPLAEAAAEDYGVPGGLAYAQGAKNCEQVLAGVFRFFHVKLVAETPQLAVRAVRLQGRRGYAILRFGHFPERELSIDREGRVWRIGAFMDNELP